MKNFDQHQVDNTKVVLIAWAEMKFCPEIHKKNFFNQTLANHPKTGLKLILNGYCYKHGNATTRQSSRKSKISKSWDNFLYIDATKLVLKCLKVQK